MTIETLRYRVREGEYHLDAGGHLFVSTYDRVLSCWQTRALDVCWIGRAEQARANAIARAAGCLSGMRSLETVESALALAVGGSDA